MPGERRGEEEAEGGRPSNDGVVESTRTRDADIPEYVPGDIEENDDKDGMHCGENEVSDRVASRYACERSEEEMLGVDSSARRLGRSEEELTEDEEEGRGDKAK